MKSTSLSDKWPVMKNEYSRMAVFLAFATLLLAFRWPGFTLAFDPFLRFEDGPIFMNQTQDLGISSFWTPTSYLHTYQRVIALVSTLISFEYRPLILLAGWFIGFLFTCAVVVRAAKLFDFDAAAIFILLALVILQPHNGETFFTLTNIQWWLGLSLFLLIICLDPEKSSVSPGRLVLFAVLGLTGPFCIVALPVLAVRFMLLRDYRNYGLYLVIFICAVIQFHFALDYGRFSNENALPFWPMVKNILYKWKYFLCFRHASFPGIVLPVVFWLVFIYAALSFRGKTLSIQFLVLLSSIVINVMVVSFECRNHAPSYAASRYTVIPYSLIFFTLLELVKRKHGLRRLAVGLSIFLCLVNIHRLRDKYYHLDSHFRSYVNFSRYSDMSIPIPPANSERAFWHIKARAEENKNLGQLNGTIWPFSPSHDLANNPIDNLGPFLCAPGSADVGLKLEFKQETDNVVTVRWRTSGQDFSERRGMSWWYPADTAEAYYAFPYEAKEPGALFFNLRVEPGVPGAVGGGGMALDRISVYCLP